MHIIGSQGCDIILIQGGAMRTTIATILLLVFVSGLIFAQIPPDLSFEQATSYAESIITIDSAYKDLDQVKYAKDTQWTPMLGGRPISRPDFFTLAGANEAAQKYTTVQQRNSALRITSWTMLSVSLVSGVVGTVFLSHDFIGEHSKTVGAVLTGVGVAGLLGFTIPIFLIEDEDKLFTASFAIKLANSYNDNLLQTIMAK